VLTRVRSSRSGTELVLPPPSVVSDIGESIPESAPRGRTTIDCQNTPRLIQLATIIARTSLVVVLL
jgi:hypothetical protein